MKRIVRYDIVCAWDVLQFVIGCQEKIDEGWIPRGPLIVSSIVGEGYRMPNGNFIHTLKYQNFVKYEPLLKTEKQEHSRDIRIESGDEHEKK